VSVSRIDRIPNVGIAILPIHIEVRIFARLSGRALKSVAAGAEVPPIVAVLSRNMAWMRGAMLGLNWNEVTASSAAMCAIRSARLKMLAIRWNQIAARHPVAFDYAIDLKLVADDLEAAALHRWNQLGGTP